MTDGLDVYGKSNLVKFARLAAVYLFWPGLAVVVWGEMTPHPPTFTNFIWDKALHFSAYFALAGMAAVILGPRRQTLWMVLGLALLGGLLEVLQGLTGRDPSLLDEVANVIGIAAGTATAFGLIGMAREPRGEPQPADQVLL
jgi:VanZ family protein